MTTLQDLGSEPFVSLTTYRKSGEPVAAPVWVVSDGTDLLVWTPASTGKVKRLRNDSRVDLAACGRRGRVAPDAARVSGTATVETSDAALRAVTDGLRRKYGLQYRVVTVLEAAVSRVRRRAVARVALRISPAEPESI